MMGMSKCDLSVFINIIYRRRQTFMHGNEYFSFISRFGKKSRPAMYDATPIAYEDYSPDDKPLVTLIKTKDL